MVLETARDDFVFLLDIGQALLMLLFGSSSGARDTLSAGRGDDSAERNPGCGGSGGRRRRFGGLADDLARGY